jgi:hypothetical protein
MSTKSMFAVEPKKPKIEVCKDNVSHKADFRKKKNNETNQDAPPFAPAKNAQFTNL